MKKLIIVGAGGAGIEALLVARRTGEWEVEGFADDDLRLANTWVEGLPVLGTIETVIRRYQDLNVLFHCAVGRNQTRKILVQIFEKNGFASATLIDPTAVIAATARIGVGTYIAPQAFVGPGAELKSHILVNVGASVGHDSLVHDFAQLCPGARLSGNAVLSEGAFIGSNGVVAPGVSVGTWSVVGAASFAARDVPPQMTAVGVPARIITPQAPVEAERSFS